MFIGLGLRRRGWIWGGLGVLSRGLWRISRGGLLLLLLPVLELEVGGRGIVGAGDGVECLICFGTLQ